MRSNQTKAKSVRKATYPVEPSTLFAAILACPRALHTLDDLAALLPSIARWDADGSQTDLKPDPDSICDALVELEVGGQIEVWPDSPKGPVIILSDLSAKQAGLELGGKPLAWHPVGVRQRRDRAKQRAALKAEVESDIVLAQAADPDQRHPIDLIEWGDRPSVLIGLDIVWNGPDQMHERHYETMTRCYLVCPGCLDRPLPDRWLCLCCHGRAKGVKMPKRKIGGVPSLGIADRTSRRKQKARSRKWA